MKYLILICALFLLFLLFEDGYAQTREVNFRKITGTDGITLGKINNMTRDKDGFLWLSDQDNRAVIRYDGKHMVKYQYDSKNPEGLGGFYPECLFADSTGIIWIGFYGQGVDRFDPKTNIFTHYSNDPGDPQSLSSDVVSALLVDNMGNLWVGTNGGLNRLNQETGDFTRFTHNPDDPTSLSHDVIRSLYEDKEGTIWVGTGFFGANDGQGGLNRFNPDTGTFTRFLHDPENPQSLMDNRVRSIFEDSRGDFWIGTNANGLHLMDRETGLFKRFVFDPSNPSKLSAPPPLSNSSHITSITEDSNNNLWIGTFEEGVLLYNRQSEKITNYNNTDYFPEGSSWWINPSGDGILWISTQEANLYQVDINNMVIPYYSVEGGVKCLYEESPSVIWYGSIRNGLIRKDLNSGKTTHYVHNPSNPNSISDNTINSIERDNSGIYWIGTQGGLNRFDPDTQIFTHFVYEANDPESLSLNDVQEIYADSDSYLWIGLYGGGLERFDKNTGKFTHYQYDPADTNSISGTIVLDIYIDANSDYLWLGLGGGYGLNKFDKSTGNSEHYLRGQSVFSTFRDKENVLWACSQTGLYTYNEDLDSFQPYNDPNTGAAINSQVYSVRADDKDNIWISSSMGLLRLNKGRDQLSIYGRENGIVPGRFNIQGNGGSVLMTSDGKLLYGENFGYYSIDPDKLIFSTSAPKLFFTNFWLEGETVIPGYEQLSKESILMNASGQVELEHDQNSFSISYTSLDFKDRQNKKIFYKLENYDPDWRESNIEDRAGYYRVPPGRYNFVIRTSNNSIGGKIEKNMVIVIAPPWWMTWWAYVIYGLIFIAGVFVVDRYQRKRVLAKANAEAKEKELEQAREIEKAYNELKTTQSQLIQSEKMASLGELTAGIAHEIQNPLNFVNNFSEVSEELVTELKEELEKGDVEEAKEISDDVIENLKKINHHGKRASGIVKGMLEHSRTGDGTKELTDINNLADEYLRLSYHGLRAKDKSFNADFVEIFDDNIGEIEVVPQDIGRVLLNLINNAFYAVNKRAKEGTEDYKSLVTVTTKKFDDKIVISVADNGTGIPKEVRDKIMQPFFTTKPTGEGTGLGLSLSYDIVKSHGGALEIESEVGKGTEFTISLPI